MDPSVLLPSVHRSTLPLPRNAHSCLPLLPSSDPTKSRATLTLCHSCRISGQHENPRGWHEIALWHFNDISRLAQGCQVMFYQNWGFGYLKTFYLHDALKWLKDFKINFTSSEQFLAENVVSLYWEETGGVRLVVYVCEREI